MGTEYKLVSGIQSMWPSSFAWKYMGFFHWETHMTHKINQDILVSRIKKKMAELAINQARLAKIADITPAALSLIINKERTPSSSILVKLAEALNESIDFLVGRTEKSDIIDILKSPEVLSFYKEYTSLPKNEKDQVHDMIEFFKHKKRRK